jgi:hypothetical protein
MSKPTSGPWYVTDGDGRERGYIRRTGSVAGELAIARVCHGTARGYSEIKANARLIAASPTMYDYIKQRADTGDTQAISILEAINADR